MHPEGFSPAEADKVRDGVVSPVIRPDSIPSFPICPPVSLDAHVGIVMSRRRPSMPDEGKLWWITGGVQAVPRVRSTRRPDRWQALPHDSAFVSEMAQLAAGGEELLGLGQGFLVGQDVAGTVRGSPATVAALPVFIQFFRSRGYRFVIL